MRKLVLLTGLLLAGCRQKVKVAPNCSAELLVPRSCEVRRWGNAVELDCKGQKPKIYYCNELKQASPH